MGSLSKTFVKIVNMRNVFLFLLILLAVFSTIEAGSKACKITKLKVAIFGCKSLCNYCHKYHGGKAKCLKVCKQKPCQSTATTTKSTSITTKSTTITTNSTKTTHVNTTSTTTKSPSMNTMTTATSKNTTANTTKISPITNK